MEKYNSLFTLPGFVNEFARRCLANSPDIVRRIDVKLFAHERIYVLLVLLLKDIEK